MKNELQLMYSGVIIFVIFMVILISIVNYLDPTVECEPTATVYTCDFTGKNYTEIIIVDEDGNVKVSK